MPKYPSENRHLAKREAIPYARGFKPPTPADQERAIGFPNSKVPHEYSDSTSFIFFPPLPQPTSIDDWLAQYDEEGQSYRQFRQENPWFSKRKQKFLQQAFNESGKHLCDRYPEGKVYVAKIGDFSEDDDFFEHLLDYVRRFLCVPACALEGLTIELQKNDLILIEDPAHNPSSRPGARIKKTTLSTRYNGKTGHLQICVDSILPKMQNVIPKDALCVIGLTQYDIYADETDLFVAGMAAGRWRAAVFSLFRYNPKFSFSQEHWYSFEEDKSISARETKRLMLQRSCKLLVHELCHLLGIDHCIYYGCCMNGSGHLKEDFDQPMMLCPVDLHKLQTLVGFNVLKRYESLLEFYNLHSLKDEANWVEKRIAFLQKPGKTS